MLIKLNIWDDGQEIWVNPDFIVYAVVQPPNRTVIFLRETENKSYSVKQSPQQVANLISGRKD
jgi:uncharacterized protein YlzI (FlbEa/FlbD family)